MNEVRCDWCKNTMHKIADYGSGLLRDVSDTFLCDNVICGHEKEIIRAKKLYQKVTGRSHRPTGKR